MLSVIVPIYNTEKYLEQCIESIINQTYKELEIILVDDGSTDSSGAICDRYAAADKRIKVIHKENGGRVSARNEGVKAATAEYVAFVDADDWLELNIYEDVMAIIEEHNCDAVITGRIREESCGTRKTGVSKEEKIYEGKSLVDEIYSDMIYSNERKKEGIDGYLTNIIWKKDIIYTCQMSVEKDIDFGEDMICVYPALLHCKKIAVTHFYGYHYRIHSGGISYAAHDDFFEKVGKIYKYLKRELLKCDYTDITIPQLSGRIENLLNRGKNELFGEYAVKYKKRFLFPYEEIEHGAKIVIYCAGEVGESYIRQLKKNNYCNVVLWVDARYEKLQNKEWNIASPEMIKETNFDYVVIAIEKPDIADSIKDKLVSMGINEEKIVWKEPPVID